MITFAAQVEGTQVGGGGGGSSEPVHTHSYSSSVTKSPTCTGTGVRTYKCTCGDSYTETIAATGHSMSGWYSISGYQHKRDCNNGCGYKETEGCNKGGSKIAYGDDDWHHQSCSTCSFVWPSSYDQKHNWAHQEGVHTCGDCGEAVAGEYHYYDVAGEAKTSYKCKYTAHGNPCTYSVGLEAPSFSGLPMSEYTCSDSLVQMPPVPNHPKGIQQFSYTGTLRASATAGPYTELKAPENWFKLYGWWQRNVVSHATEGQYTENYQVKDSNPILYEKLTDRKATGDVVTHSYVNILQNEPLKFWDSTSDIRSCWSNDCRYGNFYS